MTYNWQLPDWPEFRYELGGVAEVLLAFALTGASKATATRDLLQLARIGALHSRGGGRSTRYELGIC
jgi:hypothetical protein